MGVRLMAARRSRLRVPAREKQEEAYIMRVYDLHGFDVIKTSQPQRARGMTRGIPDLLVIDRREPGVGWWHEVKREQGEGIRRLAYGETAEQARLRAMLEHLGHEVIVGGREVQRAKLEALGRWRLT
jgi:hypothetical protein